MITFDERELKDQLVAQTAAEFDEFVTNYDKEMIPVMKARGYTCVHSLERTVAFTFGEFTFRRRRWKKGNKWVVPVDDKLGLKKNVRFSWEFMYQVAKLSTMLPYEKVTQVIEMTYHIIITKPTVVQAVKLCDQLLRERAAYRFYKEEKAVKQPIDVIYIEGDGVMVKARDIDSDNRHYDLAHFVVHTGSRPVGSHRFQLQNKKEFVGLTNSLVREQVLDYLYNTYQITDRTLLITNSDGGHGYTPSVFEDLAKALGVSQHEHFWDDYHINQKLKTFFKPYSEELVDRAFQAIKQHDKAQLATVLDTTESLMVTTEELEEFETFKRQLHRNFPYTKPAELRGFSHAGIGIMESQHRKITYRMKKRGMYWTILGAETMSQIIVLNYEDRLRDLFFGSWREDYERLADLGHLSAATIRQKVNRIEREYKLHRLRR